MTIIAHSHAVDLNPVLLAIHSWHFRFSCYSFNVISCNLGNSSNNQTKSQTTSKLS